MGMNVKRNSDPFKKYWWVILVGFGVVALWVCAPVMKGGTGGGTARRETGLQSSEESLDSINNPAGAPGSVIDLSMDGSYAKKSKNEIKSDFYQAPDPEKAAPGKALSHGSASTLASALKRAAKKDPSGWGGKKARRGFKSPKGNFGSLSGMGSGSSGGTSASYSGGGTGAFGTRNANVGMTSTRGLGAASAGAGKQSGPKFMRALKTTAKTQTAAAGMRSADGASAAGATSFDGTSQSNSSIGGGSSDGGRVYGLLDDSAAPINLKPSNFEGGQTYTPYDDDDDDDVPDVEDDDEVEDDEEMRNMIIKLIITTVVGGVVGGLVGQLFQNKMDSSSSMIAPRSEKQYAYEAYWRRYEPAIT